MPERKGSHARSYWTRALFGKARYLFAMTVFYVNIMWAMVLFGILIWTTASMVLNAALRRGMGWMGLVLSYAVLVWMLVDLPWREAAATWGLFAAFGGALSVPYELWARRRYAADARPTRPLIRLEGVLLWPKMIPDSVGLMLNSAGILPADDRNETHAEDAQRVAASQRGDVDPSG